LIPSLSEGNGPGLFVSSATVPNPLSKLRSPVWCWLACAAAIGAFLWIVAQFYLPGKGFTFFATFGDRMQARYLPELKAINYYSQENGWGYDAQYYAQLAMRPRLSNPALAQALDSLPYRARRILLSWTAWLLGGGDPVRALQVFSLQNVVAWLLLAALLWRWFPPTNCENFFRWGGVLFSAGLIWSVRGALLDGPSLLLIAVGVALAEAGRPWWSAVVLGVSGLAKETNLLAGAALAPAPQEVRRDWRGLAGRAGLLVLPLALWLVCLWVWLGTVGDSGARNFGLPLMAYLAKWRETLQLLRVDGLESFERFNVPVLVALLVQTLFFLLRPRWRETWWRIGAAYAVLMIFLGAAVWEGYPSAAVRVLLPMQLAFNIAVPRGGRGWLVLLLLGNLTLFSTPDLLKPPGRESYRVEGPRALRMVEGTGRLVEVAFDAAWYPGERSFWEYWRWAKDSASFTIRNPHPFAMAGDVRFGLRSVDPRHVRVFNGGQLVWEGNVALRRQDIDVSTVLPPGDQTWRIETSEPAILPGNGDQRRLTFSLRDLEIVLQQSLPPAAGK
jgi:hypothetical protein